MTLFTEARSNSKYWNLAKTYLQSSVLWLVLLYIIPQYISSFEKSIDANMIPTNGILGWTLFIIMSCLGLFTGFVMSWYGKGTPLPIDCAKKLVVRGPYKYVRNPMAVAGIGQGIAVGLIHGSWMVILYAFAGALLWHIFVRPVEEEDLEIRFKEEYVQYKHAVKCWIPSL